jgi:hypothetical protein
MIHQPAWIVPTADLIDFGALYPLLFASRSQYGRLPFSRKEPATAYSPGFRASLEWSDGMNSGLMQRAKSWAFIFTASTFLATPAVL